MYCDKRITITLFISLIATLIVLSVIWIYDKFIEKLIEHFDNKRNIKMKIYKSDEIFDPDEQPEYDAQDPDNAPMTFDPDQQPYLDDEKIISSRKKY
jgi:hypothetical protein